MSGVGFSGGVNEEGKKKPAKGKTKKTAKQPKVKLPSTYAEKLIRSDNPAKLKKYLANRIAGMNKCDSAREAGYSESMAQSATAKIEKPNLEYFRAIMDAYIPDELMAQKTREGLDATLVKVASFEGMITDVKEFADMPTRARYLELAAEFKGRVIRNTPEAPKIADVTVIFMGRNGSDHTLAAQAEALVVPLGREE